MKRRIESVVLTVFALGVPACALAQDTGDLETYADWVKDVGSAKFTTREPAEGETVVDKAPFLIDKPAKYIVTKDLAADGSCIAIQSGDVTLDLNGHTLRYGMGEKVTEGKGAITYNSWQQGNIAHAGILSPSRPDATQDFKGFGWNSRFRNVVVKNGKVMDGTGKGLAYSQGIDLGGCEGATVENVIVEVAAPDTFGLVTGSAAKVRNVSIIHQGTVVTNRHQQVADIAVGPNSEVSYCKLEGGPQAGVKAASGAEVHHNLIRQRATVTNCYGVQGYGQKDVKVHHNLIVSYNGRGIHVSEKSERWDVHDNYVEVRETKNKEYSRMQTHGIKFEGTRESKVYSNVVLSISSDGGEPTALNMDMPPDSGNLIEHNTFVALTINRQGAYAAYVVASDGQGSEVRENDFYSNNVLYYVAPDGGKNLTFRRCGFYRVDPSDEVLFYMNRNYKKDYLNSDRFVDCVFGEGVDPKTFYFPGKGSDWRSPGDYAVAWTLSLSVTDGGAAAGKYDVLVTDNDGKEFAKGSAGGTAKIELTQFHVVYDRDAAKATVKEFAPYTVTVFANRKARRFTVSPTCPLEATVAMDAGDPIVKEVKPKANPVPSNAFWRARVRLALKDRIEGRVGVHFDTATDR